MLFWLVQLLILHTLSLLSVWKSARNSNVSERCWRMHSEALVLNTGPISGNNGGESSIITFRANDPPASCINVNHKSVISVWLIHNKFQYDKILIIMVSINKLLTLWDTLFQYLKWEVEKQECGMNTHTPVSQVLATLIKPNKNKYFTADPLAYKYDTSLCNLNCVTNN